MDAVRLEQFVSEFREALQAVVGSGRVFNISISKRFPHACCDDSSLLLARYLSEQGYPGALRIHGRNGGNLNEIDTHVWLKLNDHLIDITGSQFEGYQQPEILIARENAFLASFEVHDELRVADYRRTKMLPQYDFNEAYDAIVSRIPGR